jgi:hypothetical protein
MTLADQDVQAWTCARCKVTATWMPGHDADCPINWKQEGDGHLYCLTCRRALAGDAAVEEAPNDLPSAGRARLRATAVVEFELRRDPDRTNGEIARAIRTSVPAVAKARERIEAA